MTADTKTLLKRALLNSASILGYVSTAVTFFPIGSVVRSYVIPLALFFIIVGVFHGALSVIVDKNKEIEAVRERKDAQIAELRTQRDGEIGALNERVAQLSRKPYAEDLANSVRQLIQYQMTHEGRLVLLHLLKNEPIEVGRAFIPEIPIERTHAQLGIAMQSGVVRHHQERQGLLRTYWVINPRFRPALEDLLYE
jgi:hypothetical protein